MQDILNKNKLLIAQIQSNHEQRTPESLAQNMVLIREVGRRSIESDCPLSTSCIPLLCSCCAQLNSNIGKVVKEYQDLAGHLDFAG